MASDKQYRTVFGIVQFDPREQEAAGKQVRNVMIRQTGFGATAPKVYLTVWPDHAHVELGQGDVIAAEGVFTQNKSKDGSTTYNNISVTRLFKLGAADPGKRAEVEEAEDEEFEADDVPF